MIFLINCSNLKNGGGLQVAHSICSQLGRYQQHLFVVVLSTYIREFEIPKGVNCKVFRYDIRYNISTLLLGRDSFLDSLARRHKVDAVLTLFGPSIWRPRYPHLCGFARAQLLLKDSPYYKQISTKERILYKIWGWGFRRSSKLFYTENLYISNMLPQLITGAKVYTVSNYYNQIYDHPEQWNRIINLNANFRHNEENVITMLTVSSTGPHKNLGIMVPNDSSHCPSSIDNFVPQSPWLFFYKIKKIYNFIIKIIYNL